MVLPTYDGKVQPMTTVWDSCPLRSTAYSSMSKLWSKSICKQICPLTNDQLRWEGADVVLPTYDGTVQPMVYVMRYPRIQRARSSCQQPSAAL